MVMRTLPIIILIVLFSGHAFANEQFDSKSIKASSTYYKVFKNLGGGYHQGIEGVTLTCDIYYLDSFQSPLEQYDPILSASVLCQYYDSDNEEPRSVVNYDGFPGDEFTWNLDQTPRQWFKINTYCVNEFGERSIPAQVILHCIDHKALEIDKIHD